MRSNAFMASSLVGYAPIHTPLRCAAQGLARFPDILYTVPVLFARFRCFLGAAVCFFPQYGQYSAPSGNSFLHLIQFAIRHPFPGGHIWASCHYYSNYLHIIFAALVLFKSGLFPNHFNPHSPYRGVTSEDFALPQREGDFVSRACNGKRQRVGRICNSVWDLECNKPRPRHEWVQKLVVHIIRVA